LRASTAPTLIATIHEAFAAPAISFFFFSGIDRNVDARELSC
jgi:hypothetical protein